MELPEPIPIENDTSRKNRGKKAEIAANASTPSALPTIILPASCPTDCMALLNMSGIKNTSISLLTDFSDSTTSLLAS
jgi:hypothetical protein